MIINYCYNNYLGATGAVECNVLQSWHNWHFSQFKEWADSTALCSCGTWCEILRLINTRHDFVKSILDILAVLGGGTSRSWRKLPGPDIPWSAVNKSWQSGLEQPSQATTPSLPATQSHHHQAAAAQQHNSPHSHHQHRGWQWQGWCCCYSGGGGGGW